MSCSRPYQYCAQFSIFCCPPIEREGPVIVRRSSLAVYIPGEARLGSAAVCRGSWEIDAVSGAQGERELAIQSSKTQSKAQHRIVPTSPGNSTPPQREREDRPPLRSIARTRQTVSYHSFPFRFAPVPAYSFSLIRASFLYTGCELACLLQAGRDQCGCACLVEAFGSSRSSPLPRSRTRHHGIGLPLPLLFARQHNAHSHPPSPPPPLLAPLRQPNTTRTYSPTASSASSPDRPRRPPANPARLSVDSWPTRPARNGVKNVRGLESKGEGNFRGALTTMDFEGREGSEHHWSYAESNAIFENSSGCRGIRFHSLGRARLVLRLCSER